MQLILEFTVFDFIGAMWSQPILIYQLSLSVFVLRSIIPLCLCIVVISPTKLCFFCSSYLFDNFLSISIDIDVDREVYLIINQMYDMIAMYSSCWW